MSGSLGKGSLTLTADAQGVTAGLNSASGRIKSWAGGLKGSLGGALKAAGAGAAAGLGFGLATAGLDSVGSFVGNAMDRIPEIAATANTGKAFGLSAETFSGMAGVAKSAGSDIRDFTEALATLTGRAGEAAGGGLVAKEMFAELGLSAADFGKLGVDDQFYKIFDALNTVQDPAKKVQLLMRAFGEDSGKNLIPLLGKSSDELRKLGGSYAFTGSQAAAAQLAQESVAKAQASWGHAYDAVVIAAAPLLEMAAELIPSALDGLGINFGKLDATAMPIVKGIAKAFGYLWDTMKAGWGVMQAGLGGLMIVLGKAISALSKLVGLFEQLPESVRPEWLGTLKKDIDEAGKAVAEGGKETAKSGAAKVNGFGDTAKGIDKWFADREKRLAEKAKGFAGGAGVGKGIGTAAAVADRGVVASAIEQNSAADASTLQAFAAEQMRSADKAQQQLEAARQANDLLRAIRDGVNKSIGFGVI